MKNRAFTLIELLIVLIIIGIIATVAVSQYQHYTATAKAAEAKNIVSVLANAVWSYYTEGGKWPNSLNELEVKPPASKYFIYSYQRFTGQGGDPNPMNSVCMVYANFKDLDSLEDGDTTWVAISYRSLIMHDTKPFPSDQIMDDDYVKSFVYSKKGVYHYFDWDGTRVIIMDRPLF